MKLLLLVPVLGATLAAAQAQSQPDWFDAAACPDPAAARTCQETGKQEIKGCASLDFQCYCDVADRIMKCVEACPADASAGLKSARDYYCEQAERGDVARPTGPSATADATATTTEESDEATATTTATTTATETEAAASTSSTAAAAAAPVKGVAAGGLLGMVVALVGML